MRTPRSSKPRIKPTIVKPAAPWERNYVLSKFRIFRTGVVIGHNRFGTRWIEIWSFGRIIRRVDVVNNDPAALTDRKARNRLERAWDVDTTQTSHAW